MNIASYNLESFQESFQYSRVCVFNFVARLKSVHNASIALDVTPEQTPVKPVNRPPSDEHSVAVPPGVPEEVNPVSQAVAAEVEKVQLPLVTLVAAPTALPHETPTGDKHPD